MNQLLLRRAVGLSLACLLPDLEGKPATANIDLVGLTKFREDNDGWLLDEVAFDPMGHLLVPLMQWAPLIDDKVIRAVDVSLTVLLLRASDEGTDLAPGKGAGAGASAGVAFPLVRVPSFSVPQSWIDGAVFADVGASVVLVSDTEAAVHWSGTAQRLGLVTPAGPGGEVSTKSEAPTSVQHPSLPGVRIGVPQGHSGDPHTHVHTPPQGPEVSATSNLLTMFVTMATTDPGSQKVTAAPQQWAPPLSLALPPAQASPTHAPTTRCSLIFSSHPVPRHFASPPLSLPMYTQAVIHGNTVTALKSLRGVDVKVFSKEEGVATAMHGLGVTVEREFDTNPFGTPVLRSMFQVLERQSQAMFVG